MPLGRYKVLLGEIGAAVGLKGEVKLRSYTQDPAAIGSYGPLDAIGRGFLRELEIDEVKSRPKGLVARIKGIATREAAEALCGAKLYVDRERLPESGEDEWYYADLIGLEARDPDGALLGTILAVHNFGAGDLLEVRPASGAPDFLVPFTADTAPEVDTARRRLTLILPEGLLETSDEAADADKADLGLDEIPPKD